MLHAQLPKLAQVQQPVRDSLDRVVAELRRIVHSDYAGANEVNDHLLWARGKLFRPTLLLLSNRVGGRAHAQAETLAAIIELVHLATLVHDDAVDHSVLRRGMPTVNALWNHQTAIIMGDYLYSRSVTELARFGRIDLVLVLAQAANEMSVGELRQLASHDALRFSEKDYDRLIASKTASLMAAACELGALVGDASNRAALARYGHALGMAFQISDDLLDYTQDAAVTGKPSGQDLREHKMTLPLIHVLQVLAASERERVEQLFADPDPGDEDIDSVVRLVSDNGGLDYAMRRAEAWGARAEEALAEVPAGEARDALQDAVRYVIHRRR
jgi:octaprenyl-diphosphate synthase